jgi:A/G-specific adenine glycosylase
MLHAAARLVELTRGGSLPRTAAELVAIKGIGRYTAGAVASIAWGEAVAVVDGNVARVLSRLFAIDGELEKGAGQKRIWELADSLVVREDASSWNQALMELGAVTCVPKNPRCASCPVESECEARARGLTEKLPRRRVKKPPDLMRRVAFVLGSRGRVLLGRRPEDGLFGGMWEPPHADEAKVAGAREELVVDSKGRVREAGVVTHVLSHRRMELAVYAGQVSARGTLTPTLGKHFAEYERFEWVPMTALHERPLTTLAEKVLRAGGVLANEFPSGKGGDRRKTRRREDGE